jgi:FdhD protein
VKPAGRATRVGVVRYGADGPRRVHDRVAAEEPLEIRLAYRSGGRDVVRPVAVTMRTPGDDVELSVGFLFAEGILTAPGAVLEVAHCAGGGPQRFNVVEVRLAPDAVVDETPLERSFWINSSCGVCGKASLDAVEARGIEPLPDDGFRLPAALIPTLPDRLRAAQTLFERTGGLHAAGLFDAAGALLVAREDVGRHNAVDKIVGHAYLGGTLPLERRVLVVSGRSSYEILQKAAAARVPVVVAVGAPSSLAVALARRFDLTLVGFARDGGFNVYAGEERLA